MCTRVGLYLLMLPFIQIDWGDLCSGVEEVSFETTGEEGVDWGVTLESGKEVMHKQPIHACECININIFIVEHGFPW